MVISSYPLPFTYEFELQLGGAVEISPRELVVLKPPLGASLMVVHLPFKPLDNFCYSFLERHFFWKSAPHEGEGVKYEQEKFYM